MRRTIPLDLNESYWLLTEQLLEACTHFQARDLSTYPDYGDLRVALGAYVNSDADNICVTDGSDEAIRIIIEICTLQKRRVIMPLPSFSGYEVMLTLLGANVAYTFYTELQGQFVFPLEQTLDLMHEVGEQALFLCQPNSPLGIPIPQKEFESLLGFAAQRKILTVVDEAYAELYGSSVADRVKHQPLIVLRTFSKAFGLPGIRLGYTIADSESAREIVSRLLPWPVSGTSMRIAMAALQHTAEFEERRWLLKDTRERFSVELSTIPGVTTYPSVANFVLARVPDARSCAASLQKKGIYAALGEEKTTQDASKELLRSTLRFAVPSPEHMPTVIASVKESMDKSI